MVGHKGEPMSEPNTLEDKAERIGIWWEGHSEGARKQLAKYVLAALREARDQERERIIHEIEGEAEHVRMGETFDGGPLHGASVFNVMMWAVRRIRDGVK